MRCFVRSLAGAGCAACLQATFVPAATAAGAADATAHPPQAIEAAAAARLRAELGDGADIEVLPLDRRLRLAACAVPLDARRTGAGDGWGATSIEVSCADTPAWRVRVRANASVERDAWLLTRAVRRGERLRPELLERGTVTLGGTGTRRGARSGEPIDDPSALMGHEFARAMRPGDPIAAGDLASPVLVHRGRQVRLRSAGSGLQVETRGVALNDGRRDELVGVKNARTGRRIDALVVGPDEVQVR